MLCCVICGVLMLCLSSDAVCVVLCVVVGSAASTRSPRTIQFQKSILFQTLLVSGHIVKKIRKQGYKQQEYHDDQDGHLAFVRKVFFIHAHTLKPVK